jgi:hypothetical protein
LTTSRRVFDSPRPKRIDSFHAERTMARDRRSLGKVPVTVVTADGGRSDKKDQELLSYLVPEGEFLGRARPEKQAPSEHPLSAVRACGCQNSAARPQWLAQTHEPR